MVNFLCELVNLNLKSDLVSVALSALSQHRKLERLICKTFLNHGDGKRINVKSLSSISQFLDEHPGMATAPCTEAGVCLRGTFSFKVNAPELEVIEDSYQLEIFVPNTFPRDLPQITEVGEKIPRDGTFHVNPDGSLCLGSPLRLLKNAHKKRNLSGYVEKCLVPYLYAVSYKLLHGGDFVLGELDHGHQGIFHDYSSLLGLREESQILQAIVLLCIEKRYANKKPCPCECGKRLGSCPFHLKLNELRKMAPISWFRAQFLNEGSQTEIKSK
jgi:hypothetical protein